LGTRENRNTVRRQKRAVEDRQLFEIEWRPKGAGSTSSPQDSIVDAGATGIPKGVFRVRSCDLTFIFGFHNPADTELYMHDEDITENGK
jgi:hypothetical protein